MDYNELIAVANVSAIILLVLLAVLLLAATRFRGENAYVAVIVVLTTIPTYLYNFCRSEEWYDIALWFVPLSFSVNTTLMPMLWMFTYRNFNAKFKFHTASLLHFLPSVGCFVLSLVYIFSLPPMERFDFMVYENTGEDMWLGHINSAVVFTQMFTYFTLIFVYLYRARRTIRENFSEAEWLSKLWIPKFMMLLAGLFLVVFVCYILWPRTDAWLFQMLNVAAMGYLVFHAMRTSNLPPILTFSEMRTDMPQPVNENDGCNSSGNGNGTVDSAQLQEYADAVIEFLISSEVYLNPNLTLQDVAKEMNVSPKKLSKAINSILGKNFFELVNSLRIEKSTCLLKTKMKDNLTLETIAEQCGFNSRYTFSNAFKKCTSMTTNQWLKSIEDQ